MAVFHSICEYAYKNSHKHVTLLFILSFVAQTFILVALRDMEMVKKLLAVQTTTSPAEFKRLMLAWTEDDLQAFRNHFYIDLFIYPITYTLFCIAWLALEIRRTTNNDSANFTFKVGSTLLLLGGTFDIIENSIHYNSIEDFKNISEDHLVMAAYFSIAKWFIMLTGVYSMLFSCVKRLYCRGGKQEVGVVDKKVN